MTCVSFLRTVEALSVSFADSAPEGEPSRVSRHFQKTGHFDKLKTPEELCGSSGAGCQSLCLVLGKCLFNNVGKAVDALDYLIIGHT